MSTTPESGAAVHTTHGVHSRMSRERELPPDVFISLRYGEAGAEARALQAALRARGISAYINDSESGVNMFEEIGNKMAGCTMAVVMGSVTYGKKTDSPNSTFQQICNNMELPCFRNCRIMIGNDSIRQAHAQLPTTDNYDDSHLTTNVISRHDNQDYIDPIKTDKFDWELDENCWRIRVFTDGSAFDPTCKYMARAGWGVYYTADHPCNAHGHIFGPIQTSYRAEVRAVIHVLRTAVNPTIIYCDCLSVVNIVQQILANNATDVGNFADGDLWMHSG